MEIPSMIEEIYRIFITSPIVIGQDEWALFTVLFYFVFMLHVASLLNNFE
jgi:hypothetical protein